MTTAPKLSEMRHALAEKTSSDLSDDGVASGTPTFEEMAYAVHLYQTDPDAYLEHYGIKGMKWGITRSKALLGRMRGSKSVDTKDSEGDVVGGIRAKTRAGAQKLKDMRAGSTLILEDANGASKIMAKQKDGTFKEVYLSADAERVLRTTKKDQSELSDDELNKAINRAKKIEEYNKIFNPQVNPNADLEARVNAMKLEIQLKQAQAALNPKKKALVKRFAESLNSGYSAYSVANKSTNGLLDATMKQLYDDLRAANFSSQSGKPSAASSKTSSSRSSKRSKASDGMNMSAEEKKRVDDFVYDITSMGKYDPSSPYGPTPFPLEIER